MDLEPRSSMSCFPQNITSSVNIIPPITQSMINFVPSTIGSCFHARFEDSMHDLTRTKSSVLHLEEADENQECEESWRAFRNEAGAWMSHRFTPHEWNTPDIDGNKFASKKVCSSNFDGRLTKEIVACGLSRLDQCPEFYHYSYTKCVLKKLMLTDIEELSNYHYLQYVDVSKNNLTTLKPLGNLPFLKYLDASYNYLTTILDFKPPYFLTTVNLSHNKIKVMKDLSEFWSITDLNLSHNNIKVINGVVELRYLYSLNLSYNKIKTVKNLYGLRIQFLYLQNNLITLSIDDTTAMFHTLNNIRTINLSNNQVSSLKMFESVENLECLEVMNNFVSELLDIYYLRNLQYLNKLNLIGNSVTALRRYIEVCTSNIKNLLHLDGHFLNYEFWNQTLSNRVTDVSQTAAQQRLKLLVLEQLNKPQIWDWIRPYDTPPLGVVVLVGLQTSGRDHFVRKFCEQNNNVALAISHTTRPKSKNQLEGEFYYHVSEEKFTDMLKQGQFFAYQELLGYYYGFTHSEYKKAENRILLFLTGLTMALSIKSRFVNAELVLTLPSTRQKHLEYLRPQYAFRLLDTDAMKIIYSPGAKEYCDRDFKKGNKDLVDEHVKFVLEKLITRISGDTEKVQEHKKSSIEVNEIYMASYDAEKSRNLTPYFIEKERLVDNGINLIRQKQLNVEQKEDSILSKESEDPKSCISIHPDLFSNDARINAIFTEELNKREELLDLHWSTPGLFKELLFSDYEAETLHKLKELIKHYMIRSGTGKPMFNFNSDENVIILASERIKKLFADLNREMSLSDKQAAEFQVEREPDICGSVECKNPDCRYHH